MEISSGVTDSRFFVVRLCCQTLYRKSKGSKLQASCDIVEFFFFFFFYEDVCSNFTVSVVPSSSIWSSGGKGGRRNSVNRKSAASRDRYRRAVSTFVTSQLLVPNPSDVAGTVMGGGYRTQVRGGTADNRRTGRFSIPNQDVTQIHATVKRTYHPPKRITGLGSSSTTAKRLRGPTRIYKEAQRGF